MANPHLPSILVLAITLVGCSSDNGPTPTQTSSPTPTSLVTDPPVTISATPTASQTVSPTVSPTSSLTPSSTPSMTGVPSPTETVLPPSPTPSPTPTEVDHTATPTVSPSPSPSPCPTRYFDGDGDGFGASSSGVSICDLPINYVLLEGDCDDSAGAIYPGAPEACDGVDRDCDGIVDNLDADADGAIDSACGGVDCDDSDGAIGPHAEEICDDGVDNNCDGAPGDCGFPAQVVVGSSTADGALYGRAEWSTISESGMRIARAGDVNGDGLADLLLSTPAVTVVGGPQNAGLVYVVYGRGDWAAPINLLQADLLFLDQDEYSADQGAQPMLGYAIAGVGDLNQDGFAEIGLGAPWVALSNEGTPELEAGRVTVLYGQGEFPEPSPFNVVINSGRYQGDYGVEEVQALDLAVMGGGQGLPKAKVHGDGAYFALGFSLARVGDVSGDGVDDLAIGAPQRPRFASDESAPPLNERAPGSALVYLGDTIAPPSGLQNEDDVWARVRGEQVYEGFASAISGAADYDGDGVGDLWVGAPLWDPNASPTAARGIGYMIPGGPGLSGDHAALSLPGTLSAEMHGDNFYLGTSVCAMEGVGGPVLVAGGPGLNERGDPGNAYVLPSGLEAGTFSIEDASLTLSGELGEDRAGNFVSEAGDLNNDGIADLLVVAEGFDGEGGSLTNSSAIYLFYGPIDGSAGSRSLATADVRFEGARGACAHPDGAALMPCLPQAVGVGDVNGDGLDDLLIAENVKDWEAGTFGAAYVYFGRGF